MARATTLVLVAALAVLLLLLASGGPALAVAARTAPADVAATGAKASPNEVHMQDLQISHCF
jgi:hypothetical protein